MPGQETTPLLRGGEANNAMENGGPGSSNSASNVVAPAAVDELPPPAYTTLSGGVPTVTCRVCQAPIDISGKRDQHVVKCSACHEATPIKNAPPGRKYVRCPCNCLLICRAESQRIACPRPNCKKVISLTPFGPPAPPMPTSPGLCQVICGHCQDTFWFNTLSNNLARCPHCRRISSVGGESSRKRGIIFLILGLLIFSIAIGVTVGTASEASQKAGLYVLYIGLFLATVLVIVRGVYFWTMKVSFATDSPTA